MRDRSRYNRACILALTYLSLVTLLSPICHAKFVNDTRRTRRDASATPRARESAREIQEAASISLRRDEDDDGDGEGDDTYHGRVARSSLCPRRGSSLDREESADDVYRGYVEDDGATVLARVRRGAADLGGSYIDRDERSALYDDYEAKEVAKRGVPGGPEDYEEVVERDSPGVAENVATADESQEARRSRAKRERAAAIQPSADLSAIESKIGADEPYPRETMSGRVVDSSAVVSDGARRSKIDEYASVTSASDAPEYERRAAERIRRKIDSIKDEIRRDIETQRRIREIRENNARFEELLEDEGEEAEEEEEEEKGARPIERRRSGAIKEERSIREIDRAAVSPRAKREGSLDESRAPAGPPLVKKKRERARRMILAPRSPAGNVDESNETGQSPGSSSLASLTGSSRELSPRLAKEYREAFGGLQSEPGSALARFKRIKRVLGGADAKT